MENSGLVMDQFRGVRMHTKLLSTYLTPLSQRQRTYGQTYLGQTTYSLSLPCGGWPDQRPNRYVPQGGEQGEITPLCQRGHHESAPWPQIFVSVGVSVGKLAHGEGSEIHCLLYLGFCFLGDVRLLS